MSDKFVFYGLQVFKSEVDNNLGASFVILGLIVSVPNADQATWLAFTDQTLFLRPHVRSVVYCMRVLPNQRAAVERRYNKSINLQNATGTFPRDLDEEYAPIVLQSANISALLLDLYTWPVLRKPIGQARDTGNFSISSPYRQLGKWRMGSFLPYYGDVDPGTLTSVSARRAACVGYIVTLLNIEEVFASVVSRFSDSDLDISALVKVDKSPELWAYYNCSTSLKSCDAMFFGNVTNRKMSEEVRVGFEYGNQNIELRCWYNYKVRLHVLRAMIAWPLLMLVVVVFCTAAVYLVLKRMSTAERDVDEREKINVKLREAKTIAEAADTAKSSFLATVSHEIRFQPCSVSPPIILGFL